MHNGFTLLGKLFSTTKFFWKQVFRYKKIIFRWKMLGAIINRKKIFWIIFTFFIEKVQINVFIWRQTQKLRLHQLSKCCFYNNFIWTYFNEFLSYNCKQVIQNHLRDLKIYLVVTRNARAQITSSFLHVITFFTI